jgi:hypothetical protein
VTQTQIPGTERELDPELTAAIEQLRIDEANLRDAKRARDKTRDRVQASLVGLNSDRRAAIERAIALGAAVYHYTDDKGDEVEASAELELKVKVRKTGAAEMPIGEGVSSDDDDQDDDDDEEPRTNGVHPGLLKQAEQAQHDSGVAEDDEGNVVPIERAAKKRAKKSKGKRK